MADQGEVRLRPRCICLDNLPLIPLYGERLRPSHNCPLHRTLAKRWEAINTYRELYDAFKVDDPTMPSFDKWMEEVP